MAQPVYLELKIAGNTIEGESTVTNMGRADSIECLSFSSEVSIPFDPATIRVTQKRQYGPVTIRKRVDKSTPLLFKALCRNEVVTSAMFRFFRLTPRGTEEHFYTVLLEKGRVVGIKQISESVIMAGESAPPMMEEVRFTFESIEWTYESTGTTHRDRLQ
jgi:type VI secretion system secreted protein Hcp